MRKFTSRFVALLLAALMALSLAPVRAVAVTPAPSADRTQNEIRFNPNFKVWSHYHWKAPVHLHRPRMEL